MSRTRAGILFATLMILLPAAGRAQESLTSLEIAGRYAELQGAAEARVAGQPDPTVSILAPLCVAYSKLKRYAKLFLCLDALDGRVAAGDVEIETDRLFVSNSDAGPIAATLRAQARLEMGDYGAAVTEAQTALSQIRDHMSAGLWPPTKYRLLNLGVISTAHAMAGDRDLALKNLKELENFSYPFIGNAAWRPMKAYAVARTYMALGDYASALPYVVKDDWFPWINDPTWGLKAGDSADVFLLLPKLVMRGTCLLETGDIPNAQHALELALRHPRMREFGELYWLALYQAGRLAEKQEDSNRAIDLYRQAVDIIEQQRASINTEASKIGFIGDKQDVYGRLIAALIAQGQVVEAFEYVERSKSRALVDMLAAKKGDFAITGANPERTKQVLAQLDAADLAAHALDQEPRAEAFAASSTRNLALIHAQIRQAAPDLAALVTVSAVSSDELKTLVGAEETLVEYYGLGKNLYAFVLDRQNLQVVKLDADGLERRVWDLRTAIQQVGGDAWRAPAQELYVELWQPVASRINTARVILVPHGVLHYLPFAALVAPDGSYLADQYALRFLPSASVLKFLRPPSSSGQAPLLVLGDPDLGDPRYDLHFANEEAKAVASIFPGSRVLVRKEASKSNFHMAAGAFTRIHFATHGEFNADRPLASGLHLANDRGGDDMLTVGELYSMSLNADLVTLSACETGLGKVANGDDVVGLTRGFLFAGARSIVASLWSVDDRATAMLMEIFYRNLVIMDKEEALRQAQITIRKNFPQPFFWAAFQLTGRGN